MRSHDTTIQEEVPDELADTLPRLWVVIVCSRSWRKLRLLGPMLLGTGFAAGMRLDAWAWSCLFLVVMMEVIPCGLTYFGAHPFSRNSVKGTVIQERHGIIVRRRNDTDIVEFPLCGSSWTEFADLQDMFFNRAFPHQGCLLIRPADASLFSWDQCVVCGFTEETKNRWKQRLEECGAIETAISKSLSKKNQVAAPSVSD